MEARLRKIRAFLGVFLACGLGFSQTVNSKLNGKRIYMHKNDNGHQGGYDGLKAWLESKRSVYGYEFESTSGIMSDSGLDTLFGRLYKGLDATRPANTIDILIFCQGEGDGNMGRGWPPLEPGVYAGNIARHAKVNTHVRSGGGLVLVHAAAGREIALWNWTFGAKLLTDWFMDGTQASPRIPGNSGHFGANTPATATLDEETLPAQDSSAYFIRKLFTRPKSSLGYGQPETHQGIKGGWYHFNAGMKYEDGSGGPIPPDPRVAVARQPVRGNGGVPDSGIGPARIFTVLTKINNGSGYIPPGKGRHFAWGREVSWGKFDPGASDRNGRFFYINSGHDGSEWTAANGWLGDLFFSLLRWVAKDDRGCTDSTRSNFNSLATVDDGSCRSTAIGRDAPPQEGADVLGQPGGIFAGRSVIRVSITRKGPHSIRVAAMDGRILYAASGAGAQAYQASRLEKGSYTVVVEVNGKSFKKRVVVH